MNLDRDALAARYREMSDEELRQFAASGDLTELALEVVLAELHRRGLPPPEVLATEPEVARVPGEGALKQVGVFLNPVAAEALRVRLLAEGLDPLTFNANGGVMGSVGLAGVKVFVPESQFDAAERIRADIEAGDYAIDENFNPNQ